MKKANGDKPTEAKEASRVSTGVNDEVRIIKTKEFLQYRFTDEELKDKSQQLARTTQEKNELENEKKTINSQFKASIDGCSATIESLANKINTGSEMRNIECEIKLNTPHVGKKQCFRLDTNEVVWEKNMDASESQLELKLDGKSVGNAMVEHSSADDNNDED